MPHATPHTAVRVVESIDSGLPDLCVGGLGETGLCPCVTGIWGPSARRRPGGIEAPCPTGDRAAYHKPSLNPRAPTSKRVDRGAGAGFLPRGDVLFLPSASGYRPVASDGRRRETPSTGARLGESYP